MDEKGVETERNTALVRIKERPNTADETVLRRNQAKERYGLLSDP